MKRKSIRTIAIALTVASVTFGCSKKEEQLSPSIELSAQKDERAKLLAFYAWCIQVPPESLVYDEKTNEFYIPNTIVRQRLERIKEEYDKANIYKENFEGK